jgi:hypothetical protein
MTETTPPKPKPFNKTDPLALKWTERAFELLQQGKLRAEVIVSHGVKVVRVDGTCPYCDDHLHYTDSLTAVTEGSEALLGGGGGGGIGTEGIESPREPQYDEFTVTCGCSEPHEGDPEKETGCGTSFRISVLVPDE